MRPKEYLDKIRLNHRYLLITICKQLKDLFINKHFSGDYNKTKIGIRRRLRAIKFIVSENRLINRREIRDRFKFNVYVRR
jgi:hypothetical protein